VVVFGQDSGPAYNVVQVRGSPKLTLDNLYRAFVLFEIAFRKEGRHDVGILVEVVGLPVHASGLRGVLKKYAVVCKSCRFYRGFVAGKS
jgi:hypothetical protein